MKKRIFAAFMAVLMLASVLPMNILAADSGTAPQANVQPSVMENTNQSDGVIFRKSVWPHEENGVPDGTVDVILEAYTTGVVTQSMKAVPTDIVLVLDVSGSMNNAASTTTTTVTTYNAANGTSWQTGGWYNRQTYYGFQSTQTTYYVNTGTAEAPHYVSVRRVNPDSNNCYYYSYADGNDNTVYVYPRLRNNLNPDREYTYDVVQFYTQNVTTSETVTATSLDVLKEAVDSFIESTHQKNVQIAAENPTLSGAQLEAYQHRISIVKFAGDQYAGGTPSVAEGDDFYDDSNGYEHNYSQVVKNLTVVNGPGHTELIQAMDSLRAVGATAIDSGMALAQKVLEPANAGTAQRNKVVLVFSDGVPTHGNEFSSDVANDAIGTAKTIKETAKVYAISVAKDSDVENTTSNLNKFFHYVSSNYPNASNLSTPGGNGNPAAGYYMVPTDTSSLSTMFQAIAENIEAPTVELGESASVVDTMSAYFTIPAGTNSVSLYTSNRVKNSDGSWGWSEAVQDTTLSCTVAGKTLEVHGFDYDENYVSDTPRTKGSNTEYYGTALIIKINAAPDYNTIDSHASTFADGYIPSNDGTANLLNSNSENMATVDTPYIQANTVTYQYTDPTTKQTVTFKSFLRLPGAEMSVIGDEPAIHGYTFTEWTTQDATVAADGSYEMPEGDVVFRGEFVANKHDVTYTITGYNPGATAPAGATDVDFGSTVDVAEDLTFPGYTFTGWMSNYPTITSEQTSFVMPDHDVELIGYFTANSGVPYKTIHYIQNLDGTYSVKETVNGAGVTDTIATAATRVYEGFTLDTTVMGATVQGVTGTVDTVSEGKITADGQLTLHQFHTRNKYTVTYAYEGSVPAGAENLLPATQSYYHGQTVSVESHAAQDAVKDHVFTGWHTLDKTTVTDDTAEFTMPQGNITLYGHFSAKENVPFHIHHYLQKADKSYPDTPNYTGTSHEVAGTKVTDDEFIRTIPGYTFDPTAADRVDEGIVSEDPVLTLKLYYTINTHDVRYEFENTVPAGATPPAGQTDVAYNTIVTVADPINVPGYIFSGWRVKTPAEVVIEDGDFAMPDEDVVLVGSFTARTNTPYRMEYYWQNAEDDGYTLHESQDLAGTTDATATIPEKSYDGFTFNPNAAGTKLEGVITADGQLVLRRYYDRLTYKVVYKYEDSTNSIPNRPALPVDAKEYRYGATVKVADAVSMADYEFIGWYSKQNGAVTPTVTEFKMPIPYDGKTVTLWGDFYAKSDVQYTIEHYLEIPTAPGTYPTTPNATGTSHGVAGTMVYAKDHQRTFTGYTYDEAASSLSDGKITEVAPGLVLKLYYTVNTYKVTYKYEGTVPAGATDLASYQKTGVPFNTTVRVGEDATAPGYKFSGWKIETPASSVISAGEFVMPAEDVVLVGSFTANHDTPYRIEYYWQNAENDEYTLHEGQNMTGITDTTATIPERNYEGFKLNPTAPGTKTEGVITADGQLVLRRYYDRLTYKVVYEYEADTASIPGRPTLPVDNTEYRHGATVQVKPDASLTDYDFIGWYSKVNGAVTAEDTSFVMPIPANGEYVTLYGDFAARTDVQFKIEHYLQSATDADAYTLRVTDTAHGAAGATVYDANYVRNFTGYTFAPDTDKEGTVATGLVLKLYYTINLHDVTYKYEGTIPAGATDLTLYQMKDVPYGTEVQVGKNATAPGYIFSGWTLTEPVSTPVADGKFVMPNADVTLVGSFDARANNKYTVEYYWQNTEDDGFTLYETDIYNNGVTDQTVNAPEKTFTGLKLDKSVPGTVASGKVTPDGKLVLKLYYVRDTYTVTYHYENSVSGAPALPETKNYRFGQTVDVADDAVLLNYVFNGWYTKNSAFPVTTTAESFVMPAANVDLWGEFYAKSDVQYKIEHYLEIPTAPDTYPAAPGTTDISHGVAGTLVYAKDHQRTFPGYHYDKTVQGSVIEGTISESPILVLKLYYKLNRYTVSYEYTGDVPATAKPTTAGLAGYKKENVPYNTLVQVEKPAEALGYIFSGWMIKERAATSIENGQFLMPDQNVTLIGSFTARTNNAYKVEYYWQNTEGDGFTLYETDVYNNGTTGATVDALEKTFTGLKLDKTVPGTVASGVVVATTDPANMLTLKLYYVRDTYTVEYKYESDVDGAPALPETKTYRFGQKVTVADDASLEHYNFHGWYTKNSTFSVNAGMASFTMPAENLTLWGEFKRIEGVHYKVEHYLMGDDGSYTTPILTEEFEDGIAGETVTGTPKKASVDARFTGYVHDPAAPGSVLSGVVVASTDPDYPLTLKLYYKRNTYRVIYVYEGVLPANRTPLPAETTAEYLSKVQIAPNAAAEGYTFSGWKIQSPSGVSITGNEFVMPAADVTLVGSFNVNPQYDVEYYLQSADDPTVYVKDDTTSHSHTAPIGKEVSAHSYVFEGYTENTTHPERVTSGIIPATGKLVLKLYYDLNKYTVTYVFENPVPAGAQLPPVETKYAGTKVQTPTPSVPGYIFSGWTVQTPVGLEYKNDEFTMPAANVVLKGKFTAGEAVYKIEHYLMNDQGTYDNVVPHTESKTGVVGDSVRATTYKPYLDMGASVDTAKTVQDGKWEGIVSPDASAPLVLKLYYSREPAIRVIYHYEGDLTQDQWRALGWPDLPTDGTAYYVGAAITVKGFDTIPADMAFEGWHCSDPSLTVAPNGQFTVPRMNGTNPVIHLYGRWTSTLPQDFTVKYFIDGVEQTQYTKTYPLDTPVTVMANVENTASHSYTPWSTPTSATEGVEVVFNSDGTFTMHEHGEVHIRCVSVPIQPVATYNVRYYLDGRLYWEGGYELFERHFIIDAPLLPPNVYFSGWSAPRTVSGNRVRVLNDRLGRPCFTMPADTVVLYGTTSTSPIYDGAISIEKVVDAPAGFDGKDTFTFHVYLVANGVKELFETVSVTVDAESGRGQSDMIYLPRGMECIVEEAGAGMPGYILTTTVTDEAGDAIGLGQSVTVGPRVKPTELTFTNTYAELSLETRDHFGYIIGYPDETVRPDDYINRAEVATIFFRLLTDAKRAEYWSQSNTFADVPANAWYNNAISTLVNAGALSGYEDNTFRPENPITRAELVKIAMSFYGTLGDNADAFNDVGEHWAAAFINAAAELGFVSGYGDDTFQPDRYVTRAEAIKIINRTLNRAPHKDHLLPDMITWVDNADTDAWYYAEIQEATNSHMYYRDNTHEVWEKIRPIRDWAELEKQWSNAHSGKQ